MSLPPRHKVMAFREGRGLWVVQVIDRQTEEVLRFAVFHGETAPVQARNKAEEWRALYHPRMSERLV